MNNSTCVVIGNLNVSTYIVIAVIAIFVMYTVGLFIATLLKTLHVQSNIPKRMYNVYKLIETMKREMVGVKDVYIRHSVVTEKNATLSAELKASRSANDSLKKTNEELRDRLRRYEPTEVGDGVAVPPVVPHP